MFSTRLCIGKEMVVGGGSQKRSLLKASDLVLKSLEISAYIPRLSEINWNETRRSATQQRFYSKSLTLNNIFTLPSGLAPCPSLPFSTEILTCVSCTLLGIKA